MSVIVAVGLGYGDEGKGSITDFLCRKGASLVVRYNGGAQAAHNCIDLDGRHHTFAQFGSGTFAGARTHLSRYMLVNPISLRAEVRHLAGLGITDPMSLLTIEQDALVTTPFHVAANRLRELARSNGRHGSCGMGIWETMKDSMDHPQEALRMRDLDGTSMLRYKLQYLQGLKRADLSQIVEKLPKTEAVAREWEILTDMGAVEMTMAYYKTFSEEVRVVGPDYLLYALQKESAVFEGAQGMLLDPDYGFHPHTTGTTLTFANALKLLEGYSGEITKLGVVRAYATRHGAGPFVTEDRAFDRLSEHDHNKTGEWQQGFRSGAFDDVSTLYAIEALGGVDGIAMTNLDRLPLYSNCDPIPVCLSYEIEDPDPTLFRTGHTWSSIHGHSHHVESIIPYDGKDRARQERITNALFKAKPVYDGMHVEEQTTALEYAVNIAKGLKTNLKIASFGPKASDKVVL